MNEQHDTPQMLTIKQLADTKILPETTIRTLVKENRLPHLKIGNRALLNYNVIVRYLDNLGTDGTGAVAWPA